MEYDPDLTSKIVKQYGIVAFAKAVTDGSIQVSGAELTKLIGEAAARAGTTFAKMYTAPGEEGIALRKAIIAARDAAFIKAGQLMPAAPLSTNVTIDDANDPKSALSQLNELAAKMQAASPTMRLEQAFERTYSSPEYRALAARERAEARARLPSASGGGRIPI